MLAQSTICSAARAAVALIPDLLWRLPAQGLRMANSSEELLDLFEERYGVSEAEPGYAITVSFWPPSQIERCRTPRLEV